jgi:hypothetical protein
MFCVLLDKSIIYKYYVYFKNLKLLIILLQLLRAIDVGGDIGCHGGVKPHVLFERQL